MKLLILEACLIAGAEIATHADVGDTVEVTKDDAISLARMGRAMFLEKSDDPTKGLLTATGDDVKLVKRKATAIKEEREARDRAAAVQSPTGMAELIASTVAAAVQAALAPAAKQATSGA